MLVFRLQGKFVAVLIHSTKVAAEIGKMSFVLQYSRSKCAALEPDFVLSSNFDGEKITSSAWFSYIAIHRRSVMAEHRTNFRAEKIFNIADYRR